MDDKTKTLMLTMATGVIKKGLLTLGASLTAHGVIAGNQVETFAAIGMVLVSAGWSFYQDYGKAILISQLDVLKAKSLAQAAKMTQNGVTPVTTTEIAIQSPTLSPREVASTVATLPEVIKANVKPLVLVAILVLGSLSAFSGDAHAQVKLVRPTGNIAADIAASTGKPNPLTGAPVTDMQDFFNARLLPDLQYSLKLAQSAKNDITAVCYQAWIDIITTQQAAVKNADGTDIAMPDPHIVTEFEKLVELRNALQPESAFMRNCSPVASMLKRDIAGFIGIVISGGAGLATLVPGL